MKSIYQTHNLEDLTIGELDRMRDVGLEPSMLEDEHGNRKIVAWMEVGNLFIIPENNQNRRRSM